jgi:hypothetical protein
MTVIEAIKQRFQERYGFSVEQVAADPELARGLGEMHSSYKHRRIYSDVKNSRPISAREADRGNLSILASW